MKKVLMNAKYRYIILVLGVVISLVIRFILFDYKGIDYRMCLSPWMDIIRDNGGIFSLKEAFYNYTPLYMYLLTFMANFDISNLYAVKIISVVFDFILAYYVSQIVFLYSKDEGKRLLSFIVVLLLPTVLLNSSFLGQCDSIYASFVVASIYYLFRDKKILSVILLGLALSVKLQAGFILPFYFVYMLRGHIKWYYFLLLPVVYFITIIPVWIVGRDLMDLLTIYLVQADTYKSLVTFFPNMYIWIHSLFTTTNKLYGVLMASILVLAVGYELRKDKYLFDLEVWLKLILLSVVVLPFILPGILARYLYLGDVFSVIYIFLNYKKILVMISTVFISLYAYSFGIYRFALSHDYPMRYFSYFQVVSWNQVTFLYFVLIIYLIYDLIKTLQQKQSENKNGKNGVELNLNKTD